MNLKPNEVLKNFGITNEPFLNYYLKYSHIISEQSNLLKLINQNIKLSQNDHNYLEFEFNNGRKLNKINSNLNGSVAIIGAGLAGMIFAKKLSARGLEVDMFEKNEKSGGTWAKNDYPESRVDIPGLIYYPSTLGLGLFGSIYPTKSELSKQIENDYEQFNGIKINFKSHVIQVKFEKNQNNWKITFSKNGKTSVNYYNFVVLALGRLSHPKNLKHIFSGDIFNTFDLTESELENLYNKKVVILGNGASGMQASVGISKFSKSCTLISRSPHWIRNVDILRKPNNQNILKYKNDFEQLLGFIRIRFIANSIKGDLEKVIVDPNFFSSSAVSELNLEFRDTLTRQLDSWFDGAVPRNQYLPDYPPGFRRILLDDGSFAERINSGLIQWVNGEVNILEEGVSVNGKFMKADALIKAIGFEPGHLLNNLKVIGIEGCELNQVMGPGQICHGGTTVSGFPNLFLAHGPNSNVVVNGSNTHIMEIQVNHVLKLIELSYTTSQNLVEVKKDAMVSWHEKISSRNRKRAWGISSKESRLKSWYTNEYGQNTENWPDTSSDMMSELNESLQNDYFTH